MNVAVYDQGKAVSAEEARDWKPKARQTGAAKPMNDAAWLASGDRRDKELEISEF
jgi:hypothetical protein